MAPSPQIPPSLALTGFWPGSNYINRLKEYAAMVGFSVPFYENPSKSIKRIRYYNSNAVVNNVRYKPSDNFRKKIKAQEQAAYLALTELGGDLINNLPVRPLGWCIDQLSKYAQKMKYAQPTFAYKIDSICTTPVICCIVEVGGIWYIGDIKKTKKKAAESAARAALHAIECSPSEVVEKPNEETMETISHCKRKEPEPVTGGAVSVVNTELVPEVKVNVDDLNTELGPEAIKIPAVNSSLDNEVMTIVSANHNEGPDVKRLKTGTVSFVDLSPQVVKVKKTRIKKSGLAGNNAVQAMNVDAVKTELGPEATRIQSADNNLGPELKVNIDAVNTELGTEAIKIPDVNSSLHNELGPDVMTGTVSFGDSLPQVVKVKKTTRSRKRCLDGKNVVQARNVDAVNTEAIPSAHNNLGHEVMLDVDAVNTELGPEAKKIPSVNSSLDNEVMTVLSVNLNEGPDVKTGTVSLGDSSPQAVKVKKTRKSKKPCLDGKNVVQVRNDDAVNTELGPEATRIPSADNNNLGHEVMGNIDAVNTELGTEAINILVVNSSLDNEVMTVLPVNPNEGPDVKTGTVSLGDSSPQAVKVKKTRKSKKPCLDGKNVVQARNDDAVNTELGPEATRIPTSDNNLVPEVKGDVDAVNTELGPEAKKIPSVISSLDNEVMNVVSVNPNEGTDVKTGTVSSSPQVVKVKKTRKSKKPYLADENAVQASNVDAVNTEAIKIPTSDKNLGPEMGNVML